MIKCCIFDLDGTLLDTLTTIKYYLDKTLTAHSLPIMDKEECRIFVGKGARNLVTRTLNARGITDAEFINSFFDEYNEDYDKAPYHLTEIYDGIVELLDVLLARGIRVAVLSNKPDFATRSVVRHFFGDKIGVVYGGRDGVKLKPSPEGVELLLSELGISREECAYIGDSDIDVLTGKAAGIDLTISVTWGLRTRDELFAVGAKIFVDHPSEIPELIGL